MIQAMFADFHLRGAIIQAALLAFLTTTVCTLALANDVIWTRFRGKVKAVNQKTQYVTLQNDDGDLVMVKATNDVTITSGKDTVPLANVGIDDKVTLLYSPKALAAKDEEESLPGAPLPQIKR